MECPECHHPYKDGQRFCASCGHKLDVEKSQNPKASPTHNKFCSQCGANITTSGDITLARSGLITQVNQNTLDILGFEQNDMLGKPFSIFVEHSDLVIFFSHLNELMSSSKKQSFEIDLKHKDKKNIYVKLQCVVDKMSSVTENHVHLFLTDITDRHRITEQMQSQQNLMGLIFTITNNISTVSKEHLDKSIEDALKKICLFTKADRSFIYRINMPLFRLDPLYEWRQPIESLPGVKVKPMGVSLSKLKRTMLLLRQEKRIIAHDTTVLEPVERDELRNWHHTDIGALICHIIYSEKYPIGVIGVARQTAINEWEPNCVELVKFFGDFIANRLSVSTNGYRDTDKPPPVAPWSGRQAYKFRSDTPVDDVDMSDIDPDLDEEIKKTNAPPATFISSDNGQTPSIARLSMKFKKVSEGHSHAENKQSVFPRGDGLVLLTCPHCGIQEPVSVEDFDKLGNAVRVTCPCSNQFNVMLEKRRFFRKSVHLDGYFSLSQESEPSAADNTTWGPMVITDLSKTGLQFTSRKANLVHLGDLLMVRFNLDNENQSLIHKPVRVISVSDKEVGCQFEGADNYDITLGLYFM